MEECKKRVRDDSEQSDLDSPEAKRIRDDLLGILGDDYSDQIVDGRDPAVQDLDSVMKSFEEEISKSGASPAPALAVVDLTSDSCESQPELGYLLEASDDELGLPPTVSSSDEDVKNNQDVDESRLASDAVGVSDLWGFDDGISSYDSLGFGSGYSKELQNPNSNEEILAFEGLFDYSDMSYVPPDFSEFQWRPETLPAL